MELRLGRHCGNDRKGRDTGDNIDVKRFQSTHKVSTGLKWELVIF